MLFAFVGVIFLSLATYVIPALLSRQRAWGDASGFFAGKTATAGSIFQNASVAYALQMATFGPFFVWGASGSFLPGLLNSVFFGLGIGLIYVLRKPILAYLTVTLQRRQSITIHEFISDTHGGSALVRVAASALTIFALSGIIMSEMFVAGSFLKPVMGGDVNTTYAIFIVMFLFMFLYTGLGGNEGVMRADQFQLGVAYVALFLVLAGLLALSVNAGASAQPALGPALAMIVAIIALLFCVKRLRFLDSSVALSGDPLLLRSPILHGVAKGYAISERVLNGTVIFAAAVCALASAYLLARLGQRGVPFSVTAIGQYDSSTPPIALFALCVLPLVYQICDITNWQRLAAFRPDSATDEKAIRKGLRGFTLEAPAVWVLMMLFGAVATLYPGVSGADPISDFVTRLAGGGWFGQSLLGLLLVGVFAIALSTMDAVLSASLMAFRMDILPFLEKRPHGDPSIDNEARELIRTGRFGVVFYGLVILMFYLMDHYLTGVKDQYLAILLAFYSAQTAFFPLVLGALLNLDNSRPNLNAGRDGAVCTLLVGFLAAIGMTVVGLFFGGGDLFTWGAIPGAVIAGSFAYAAACVLATRKRVRGIGKGA